jgi:hypothetical protein
MGERIEQRIAEVFREDAGRAPVLDAEVSGQVVSVVRRRRARWGIAAGLTVAVLAIGAPLARDAISDEPAPPAAAGRSGALPGLPLADCQPPESPAAVAALAVSFDGTVTAIAGEAGQETAVVTFQVGEWFRGGPGATTTAILPAPLPPGRVVGEAGPAVTTGTRLLVSGDALGGGRLLARMCGYTRYYDDRTAAAWRRAVNGR